VSWLILNVHSATVIATVMMVVCVAAYQLRGKWARFVATASLEVAIICALFALWQVANGLARGHTTGGRARGRDVWNAERWLHLPNEVSFQKLFIHDHELLRLANYFYESAHFTTMVVFLAWLWLRHRDRYPFVRNVIAAFTAMSLLMQMVQVAPPRLIGVSGLVDTGAAIGPTVYNSFTANIADQYAAMPSIHVAWAAVVALGVFCVARSPWRWIVVLHLPFTMFVVAATGHHWWLDGVVALVLLAVGLWGDARWRRARAKASDRRAVEVLEAA